MKMIILTLLLLMLSGCFTTTLVSPENTPVRIMAENEKASYQAEFKDWYLFAGLVPLYRHNLAELIREEKLVEVRVRTEDRVSDGMITLASEIFGFIVQIFPQTIVVEGNTAEHAILANSNSPH